VAKPTIRVRGVSKDFLLPHLRQRTVKGHVLNLFRRSHTIEVQHALRDISFDVARGEFFGIVGRNGSGKSTLLKILAGIYTPTRGDVSVTGKLAPFIELGVGFNPELTGRENVYLNGALLGFSKGEVEAMYGDIVAFAELEESMDQKLKNYSSGMQVRIAFSVATRAKADVLLIDEVLAVGDAAFQRKCFEHFRALKKSKTTIVFVTHDMGAVRQFCDRAILIEESRIVAQGGAEDIATRYTELFTPRPTKEPKEPQAQGKRRGEGAIRYTKVTAPALLGEDGSLTLELEAVAEQAIDEPVYGFVIKSSSGAPVFGASSILKKQPPSSLGTGDRVRLTWSAPNVFSDGLHHVDLTITDRQGLAIYDWWEEAAAFTVVKEEKSPYIVTPDTSLVTEVTPNIHATTVTAPSGTRSYAPGGALTVSWTTGTALTGGRFGVWVRDGAGAYVQYQPVAGPAEASASFTTDLTLDVPAGSGYQAIVAYDPAGGTSWVVASFGTSPGSFTVTGGPAFAQEAPARGLDSRFER